MALLTQLQRLDVSLLNDTDLHTYMYTGLDCTAFNIMLMWLEPVLPVYGSNPEMLLMTLIRMHRSLLQEDLAVQFVVISQLFLGQ